MIKFTLKCILFVLLLPLNVLAQNLEKQEISFRENPNDLYQQIVKKTRFPLDFSSRQQFEQVAQNIGYQPDELHRDLELLARLNLEVNVKNQQKYPDASLLIEQLDAIASSPYEQAMVSMLKARYMARKDKAFTESIEVFNQALARITSKTSEPATLLKYIIHEQLSDINRMVLRPIPALSHLNHYREIAYQLRNEYFISLAESALGKYYNKNNDQAKSLQHYSEAFRIANRLPYAGLKAHAQLNLAKTYRDLKQWDDALKHAHNAVLNFQQLDQPPYVANALTAIAVTYRDKGQWNKAIDYYLNAGQINSQLGNTIALGLNYHNLGEAFAEIGDIQAALDHLEQANTIFTERKLNHYLIYNELLFAQITLDNQMWIQAIEHANNARELATSLSLQEEHSQSLHHLAQAYQHTNQLTEAIDVFEQIIELSNSPSQSDETKQSSTELTEQKLKFELSLMKNRLETETSQARRSEMQVVALFITCAVLIIIAFAVTKRSRHLASKLTKAEQLATIEPTTGMPGFNALITKFDQLNQVTCENSIALINIHNLNDDDVNLGTTESNKRMLEFIAQLEQKQPCSLFVIRPGMVACCFDTIVPANTIMSDVQSILPLLPTHSAIPRFMPEYESQFKVSIGHINLPLLDNPDATVLPTLQFETLLFALAAAQTINESHTYVSLKTLNFAPATIFTAPLFLNLNQALNRGIIRAESNYSTVKIKWPQVKMRD